MAKEENPRHISKRRESEIIVPPFPQLQAGDQTAWNGWISTLTPLMIGYAQRKVDNIHTSEDLVNTAWERVIRKLTQPNSSIQSDNLNGYVLTTLGNLVKDHFKRAETQLTVSPSEEEMNVRSASTINVEEQILQLEESGEMRALLDQLPLYHREALEYLAFGFTPTELAVIMGTSVGAVKAKRFRAVQALKRIYFDRYPQESETEEIEETQEKQVIFDRKLNQTKSPEEQVEKIEMGNEEEETWLRTIHRVGFSRSLLFLRLYQGKSQEDFAKYLGIEKHTLSNLELGKRRPSFQTINKIIEKLPFDSEGKVAQLLRLSSNNEQVPTVKDFKEYTFGKMINYFRTLQGVSIEELAEALYCDRRIIMKLERGQPTRIGESVVANFITWLGLSESAFVTIIAKKASGKQLEDLNSKIEQEISNDKYLFADNLPKQERRTSLIIKGDTIGSGLRKIREFKGFSQNDLERTTGIGQAVISRIESGTSHPHEVTLLRLMNGMEFDIHHPLTHALFDLLYPDNI